GRDGRASADDAGACARSRERALRARDHVHRRRPGHRHDRGAGVMAAHERVLVEIAAGIGSVTLNRPEKLNAFDRAMCDELLEALRLLSGSDGVRVIAMTGAGRAFCAGADLGVLGSDGPALVAAGKDVALALRGAPDRALAAAWAAQPPSVVRRAKAALYRSEAGGGALEAVLDLEITQQNELFATPDVRARIAGGASIAKRSD